MTDEKSLMRKWLEEALKNYSELGGLRWTPIVRQPEPLVKV